MRGDEQKRGKRVRRMLLCASGAYICYGLPRIVLHLLHHFADDVQVVLSPAAAKWYRPTRWRLLADTASL